jgi:hypothetical protein
MMSLQLYQNASQSPRKLELMEGDLEAEVRKLCSRQDGDSRCERARNLDKHQGPHRTTSVPVIGKFHATIWFDELRP